jgi:hypothetical protein
LRGTPLEAAEGLAELRRQTVLVADMSSLAEPLEPLTQAQAVEVVTFMMEVSVELVVLALS